MTKSGFVQKCRRILIQTRGLPKRILPVPGSPDCVLGLEAEEEGGGEVSDILDTLLVAGGSDRLQVAVEEGHEVPASTGSLVG